MVDVLILDLGIRLMPAQRLKSGLCHTAEGGCVNHHTAHGGRTNYHTAHGGCANHYTAHTWWISAPSP